LLIKRVALFLLLVPLCICTLVPVSHAQQASVDTTRTTLETPIRLSVTLPESNGEVDISAIQDFKVLSQGSSSSVRIINGRVTSERIKTYTLLPLREGRLTIPALRITIDGETGYTEPIVVQVTKSAASAGDAGNIQVTAAIVEKTPYLGQQIIYTFRLLYGVQITNTNYKAPSFDSFSAVQIGEQQATQPVIDGRRFQEISISYLLVPLKTGAITIEPAELQCDLVSSRRGNGSQFDSFFNDSFFGGAQLTARVFRTDPVTVNVQALPPWTGNDPFSGLVGRFEIKTELESHQATAGESVTLSVTLQGDGNLQDAEMPEFKIPDTFKQYADQPENNVRLEADGYTGTKIFRTALVPINEGDYTLTTAPMVYFDPTLKTYRSLTPPPLSITVMASAEPVETPTVFSPLNATGALPDLQKKRVDFTGRDILSIKTGLDTLSSRETVPVPWFLCILLTPGLLFLAFSFALRALEKDERPTAEMTRKSKMALKEAVQTAGADSLDLLSHLYRALLYAVFARAGILGEALTSGEAETLLKQNGVKSETAAAASVLFTRIESARFGKNPLSRQEQKSLTTETRKMVKGLVP